MVRFLALILVALSAAPVDTINAQVTPEPVKVDLDFASFAYDGSNSLVELYLAVDAASLEFAQSENLLRASLPLNVAITRGTDVDLEGTTVDSVWQDSLSLDFVLSDTSGLQEGQYFVHQIRSTVPPGEYRIEVEVPANDDEMRAPLLLQRDLVVPDFSDQSLVGLSDLTLATSIERSDDRESQFYKNGLSVRPNANQLFGNTLKNIFYYVEAYNLAAATGGDDYVSLVYISEANTASPEGGLQKRSQRPAQSPDVIVGSFDISTLPSGSYFLKVALLNMDNEALVEQGRKFFVYNPSVQRELPLAAEVTFETSEFASMSEEEVDLAYDRIDIITTQQERRRARATKDLDGRRRYLMDFWHKRDPNPGTLSNEFRDEFYQRIQFANERYSTGFSEGWQTDRGRIIVKHGVPGNVEPHLYDRDKVPHEIWEYNNIPGEGQAIFVFADRSGFGEFELIHSTVTGERRLSNWQTELLK
ncbi:MAG: GWxTD domain-containing protein [Rhodothermales bacterium]|nr:GWxTD domain-containing protein [Rhodothermales bacterium]